MFDDILGRKPKLEDFKKIIPVSLTCKYCKNIFMIFDCKDMNIDFPDIKDQPCSYCFKSESGKKFDKNGKEIK